MKNNIRSFRPSEEFETLQSVNQVQYITLQKLQEENEQLKKQIEHLEQLLFSKAMLIGEVK